MRKLVVVVVVLILTGLVMTSGVAGASPVFSERERCVTGEHALSTNTAFNPTTNTTILRAQITWHDAKRRHKVVIARNLAVSAGSTFQRRFVIHDSIVRNLDVVLVSTGGIWETDSPLSGPC
jgi:hypothetical protein